MLRYVVTVPQLPRPEARRERVQEFLDRFKEMVGGSGQTGPVVPTPDKSGSVTGPTCGILSRIVYPATLKQIAHRV